VCPDEVVRLLAAAPGLKYKAALSVAYGAGLRANEVISLKVGDIDSKRMLIRVEQGKGRKDRYVMLSPHLLNLLRAWWKAARPQGWLFSRARSSAADDHAPAQSRLPRRGPDGRDQQARVAAHAAAQLCHPPTRAEHRCARDPGHGLRDPGRAVPSSSSCSRLAPKGVLAELFPSPWDSSLTSWDSSPTS
jgi:integrase